MISLSKVKLLSFFAVLSSFLFLSSCKKEETDFNVFSVEECRLTYIKDSLNKITSSFTFDANKRPIKMETSYGYILNLVYSPNSQIVQFNSSLGTKGSIQARNGRVVSLLSLSQDSVFKNGVKLFTIKNDTGVYNYNGNGQLIYYKNTQWEVDKNSGALIEMNNFIVNFTFSENRVTNITTTFKEFEVNKWREEVTSTDYFYDLNSPTVKSNPVFPYNQLPIFGTSLSNRIPVYSVRRTRDEPSTDLKFADSTYYTAEVNSRGYPTLVKSRFVRGKFFDFNEVSKFEWSCD